MNSRIFANGSFLPLKSARRKATVTISVPLADKASRMLSGEGNFPVPKIRRESKVRPAMTNGRLICDMVDNVRKSRRFVEARTKAKAKYLNRKLRPGA